MSKKLLSSVLAAGLILGLFSAPTTARTSYFAGPSNMPPNEDKILQALEARGTIPAGTPEDKAQEMLRAYLQNKLNPTTQTAYPSPKDQPRAKGAKIVADNEKILKGTGATTSIGPRLTTVPPSTPLPLKKTQSTGKILALLVDFAAGPGPVAGQLPKPADPDKDYWVPNFDNDHYTKMLFDKTPGANSLANFYLAQSDGRFTVDGGVYGWIHLPYPESYYGADASSGHDNLNGPAWRIVRDIVDQAQKQGLQIPFKDFDADNDGYVDSLMVIHAGAGQEGGGGAQGDDAIWSHSWYVDYAKGGYTTWDGTKVGPYTIEPEDGAVGVFAHEYGHQLGLPDLYDTTYIGESATGFYSLMSSGSWNGKPLGTQPANLDIWSKFVLGWAPDLATFDVDSGKKLAHIRSTETYGTFNKGFRINLPQHPVTTSINTPFEGQYEWWSSMGDDLSTTMTKDIDLTGVSSATLNFKTWYQTELDYDYGYVEVSTDNGATFTRIPGNITRNVDGIPSIDGDSNGWVDAVFDLSAYAGKNIKLQFHYLTDGGVALKGWAIDSISIPEIGFTDNAEATPNGWTLNGFRQFAGVETTYVNHYYIGELVRPYATNAGLAQVYNYYGPGNSLLERFKYEPGVLLWYRDTAYIDNNVGLHPGKGRVLLVDAHSAAMLQANGKPFRTRIQVFDAPFNINPTSALALHGKDGVLVNFPALNGVSLFDDSKSYYDTKAPYNSVITPTYGVKMSVNGIAEDGSAAFIGVQAVNTK